jgi:hypothetical protein
MIPKKTKKVKLFVTPILIGLILLPVKTGVTKTKQKGKR